MTEPEIPSLRRRPIPGMSANTAPQLEPAPSETDPGAIAVAAATERAPAATPPAPAPARRRRSRRTGPRDGESS